MQLIKLILWLIVTVTIAYFLTDIRIGGMTLKQNIDTFLQSDAGHEAKRKAKEWVNRALDDTKPSDPAPASPPSKAVEPPKITSKAIPESPKIIKKQAPEEFESNEEKALKKMLKAHD